MSATTTNKHKACRIFTNPQGKRFGGFDECLEWEENRTCAEDLSLSSDLSLITLEAKKGRGLPEIVFYYNRYNNDCTSAHNTKETDNEGVWHVNTIACRAVRSKATPFSTPTTSENHRAHQCMHWQHVLGGDGALARIYSGHPHTELYRREEEVPR